MEDPFYAVRDDLSAALANAKRTFARWQGLLKTAPASADLTRTATELKNALSDMDADLAELDQAVTIAESNPGKFKLAATEVKERRTFVASTKKSVAQLRAMMQDEADTQQQAQRDLLFKQPATKKPPPGSSVGVSDSGAAAGSSAGGNYSNSSGTDLGRPLSDPYGARSGGGRPKSATPTRGGNTSYRDSDEYRSTNSRFVENEQMQQQQIMREQDYALEGVYNTVQNLREIAITIGDEADDQKVLLDDLDHRVDNTSDRMQLALKRMNAVLAELRKGGTCTIVCLVTVLLILLVVVIVI